MELFSRQRKRQINYELVRRQSNIDALTAIALEAHTAVGTERRAAAQQVHDTVQAAQKIVTAVDPHLLPEREQAVYFRLMAFNYEVLDITNQTAARIVARSRR